MVKQKKLLILSLVSFLIVIEFIIIPVFPILLNNNIKSIKRNIPETEIIDNTPFFQKGLSYSAWSNDAFSSLESDESLNLLTETKTEWIAICFSWFQSNTTSHDIRLDPIKSPSIESIQHAITTAHKLGLKVMLKPMVEPLKREETRSYPLWRGEIQPSEDWFLNYSHFINFFAEFSEENNVEMFCIGCEYKETSREKEQWEKIILEIRARFSGPLTYAADWTNYKNIEWWSSLDYVGIDAYFPLTLFENNPSYEDLKTVWINNADEIEKWQSKIKKPVIFTEIGYRSGDGTSMAPSNYWSEMEVDLQEQNDCYQAAFETLWNRDWFYGFYWWTWTSNPTDGGFYDSGHSPQNKPVQGIITSWYSIERKTIIIDQIFTSAEKGNVNDVFEVGFHAKWKNSGVDVAGATIFVNGTEYVTNESGWISFNTSYNTVGERFWIITKVQHPEATNYIENIESPRIIWDKIIHNFNIVSTGFGTFTVRINIIYSYSEDIVTGAVSIVNGKQCEEIQPGIYQTEIDSWNPFEMVSYYSELDDFFRESGEISVINPFNLLVYIIIIILIIFTLVYIKKRIK